MKFTEFMLENFIGFFVAIFLVALIGLLFIGEYDLYKSNENQLEKECYKFYKENDYILEECSKFKDKLKKD